MTALPLSPAEHEHSHRIDQGVDYLVSTPRDQRGKAVVELQRRFGMTAAEACQAIREYNLRIARAS